LNRLKKVLVVTTLGSPGWVDRLVMRQPVKLIMKRALLGACAKSSKLRFLTLYNSEKSNEKKIGRFIRSIDRELAAWKT
jgi:NAD(P)H dehydrogenase (quinone)